MGRLKVKEPKTQFTVMLKPSLVKEIDKVLECSIIFPTRSSFMGYLIAKGVKEFQNKKGAI